MTIKMRAISVAVQQERETIDVTGVAGSSGTAFAEARATRFVKLINLTGETPIEYRVGSGAWLPLSESDNVTLEIDLSLTTVRVRRAGRINIAARAQIFFDLALTESSAVQTESYEGTQIVISDDAPNDADGRPDGTLWIQV